MKTRGFVVLKSSDNQVWRLYFNAVEHFVSSLIEDDF